MSTLDRYTIGKSAAMVVLASPYVRLVPGTITGIRSVIRSKSWDAKAEDAALWTPLDGFHCRRVHCRRFRCRRGCGKTKMDR